MLTIAVLGPLGVVTSNCRFSCLRWRRPLDLHPQEAFVLQRLYGFYRLSTIFYIFTTVCDSKATKEGTRTFTGGDLSFAVVGSSSTDVGRLRRWLLRRRRMCYPLDYYSYYPLTL